MNITSAQYVNHPITDEQDCIRATIDNVVITVPLDPANRHYAEILKQVEAGTLTIEEVD